MELNVDIKKLKLNIQPHVLAGILKLNEKSSMSFKDMDRLVKSDQSMTALILKAANSSLYSRGGDISTLQHAISLLGFQVVRSLAMVAASKALFEAGNYSRFRRYVWEHSVVTAITARNLAIRLKMTELEEEAFIAGLLHDIGKVIMNILDRKKFIEVITKAVDEKIPFSEAEKSVFGYSHLDIGELAINEWHLPALYKPILSLHMDYRSFTPVEGEEGAKKLLHLVSYANYLAKRHGFGHFTAADADNIEDIQYLEGELGMKEADVLYFTGEYARTIAEDEFYNFFMTVI